MGAATPPPGVAVGAKMTLIFCPFCRWADIAVETNQREKKIMVG